MLGSQKARHARLAEAFGIARVGQIRPKTRGRKEMLSKSHSERPDNHWKIGHKRRLTTKTHLPPAEQEGQMGGSI